MSMMTSGVLDLLRRAATGHAGGPPLWRRGPRRSTHDVIVVGGDAFALLTAWTLAEAGEAGDVALLTADGLGGGAPLAPDLCLHGMIGHPRLAALAAEGLRAWRTLPAALGYAIGLDDRRHLVVARQAAGRRQAAAMLHAARAAGLAVAEIDCPENGGLPVPGGVAVQEDAATVQLGPLLFGLARAAAARGVDVIDRRAARSLRVEAGRVVGIDTAEGLLRAPRIVLAGAEGLALASAPLVPGLVSLRRHVLIGEPLTPSLDTALHWPERDLLITQAAGGEIVLRGGGRRDEVAALAVQLVPRLSRLRVGRWHRETLAVAPDGGPVLGALPTTGLFAGLAGGAAALWPALARRLADQVVARPGAADALSGLGGERLAEGRLFGPLREAAHG
jgi:sarcosine oxidase subunit beta